MTKARKRDSECWPALVGDIGGTNARFGTVESSGAPVRHLRTLRNANFGSLEAAIDAYLAEDAAIGIRSACLAVAGPITGDRFRFSNIAWEFSQAALSRKFGLAHFRLVNDFAALALAVPTLDEQEFMAIGGTAAVADAPIAVIGPGTGLGVAALLAEPGGWRAIATEGGHSDFAPVTELEIAVLRHRRRRFDGQVSAENVLCGAGIASLHETLAEIHGDPAPGLDTATIIARATDTASDPACARTLELYCEMLGGFAGNVALTVGARGGVVLGGGILPRMPDYLTAGGFRRRFEAKGMMRDYVSAIPVRLILAGDAALRGAAALLTGFPSLR